MNLEGITIEIDELLVGEIRNPSENEKIFIPEDNENPFNLKKVSPNNTIVLNGREVSYKEFSGLITNYLISTRENYHRLWGHTRKVPFETGAVY